jgi:hypothetical protein
MKLRVIRISFLLCILMGSNAFAQNKATLPYHSKDSSVGVVNCASSLCHGSITEWKDSNVLQNEYVTWSRFDKHARAYNILLNEKSQSIAKKFGLGIAPIMCHKPIAAIASSFPTVLLAKPAMARRGAG